MIGSCHVVTEVKARFNVKLYTDNESYVHLVLITDPRPSQGTLLQYLNIPYSRDTMYQICTQSNVCSQTYEHCQGFCPQTLTLIILTIDSCPTLGLTRMYWFSISQAVL